MSPAEVAARLREVLGVDVESAYGVVTATVPRGSWVAAVASVRDDDALGGGYFDVLLGTDLGDDGLEVVVRLWSVAGRHALLLRTTCPVEDPHVPSLTGLFAGAAWHERAAAEMLGLHFDGHPGLRPLLLPAGVEEHPLRKDVVLAQRQAQPWPGAVEPGESEPNPRRLPPGSPTTGRTR